MLGEMLRGEVLLMIFRGRDSFQATSRDGVLAAVRELRALVEGAGGVIRASWGDGVRVAMPCSRCGASLVASCPWLMRAQDVDGVAEAFASWRVEHERERRGLLEDARRDDPQGWAAAVAMTLQHTRGAFRISRPVPPRVVRAGLFPGLWPMEREIVYLERVDWQCGCGARWSEVDLEGVHHEAQQGCPWRCDEWPTNSVAREHLSRRRAEHEEGQGEQPVARDQQRRDREDDDGDRRQEAHEQERRP